MLKRLSCQAALLALVFGVILSLSGSVVLGGETRVFAQVGSGIIGEHAYRTIFLFSYEGNSIGRGELRIFRADGTVPEFEYTIETTGTVREERLEEGQISFELEGPATLHVFLVPTEDLNIGWARVTCDSDIQSSARFQLGDKNVPESTIDSFENALLREAEHTAVVPMSSFSFPLQLHKGVADINTAFALVNLSARSAEVELLRRPDQVETVTIGPGEMFSGYYDEVWLFNILAIFPARLTESAMIRSSVPLGVTVFRTLNGFPLTGVPVHEIQQSHEVAVEFENDFQLRVGETAVLPAGQRLTFWNPVEDSRCAVDVVCVWEGRAVMEMRWHDTNGRMEQFNLIDHAGDPVAASHQVGDYVVRLLRVDPTPHSEQPFRSEDYLITLRVEERPVPAARPGT